MWKWLMDALPDLKQGTFEVRDLLNLLMTGLGAYLAWRAIQMGREQTLTAKRQTEIAEFQHQIMQEHRVKSQMSLYRS